MTKCPTCERRRAASELASKVTDAQIQRLADFFNKRRPYREDRRELRSILKEAASR